MSFRRRLALVSAAAVAVAIVVASAAIYVVVRGTLRDRVDEDLRSLSRVVAVRATEPAPGDLKPAESRALKGLPDMLRLEGAGSVGRGIAIGTLGADGPVGVAGIKGGVTFARKVVLPRDPFGGPAVYAQFLTPKGKVVRPGGPDVALKFSTAARQVAKGKRDAFFSDTHVKGTHVRVFTARIPDGGAIQAVRSLTETDRTLRKLAFVLFFVSLAGIALAAALGRMVARTAVAPVARLTEAAEHVAATRDLGRRIEGVTADPSHPDELDRLAHSFNTMLAALEDSVRAQRALVADASHELRTPLTSLRTNIEVLAQAHDLAPATRQRLLHDVVTQLEELSALVGDLVDLAREQEPDPAQEDVRLDQLTEVAVARARRHAPEVRFSLDADPCVVRATEQRLDRALANLLDNAAKWSPDDGCVDVAVRGDGTITVRDHGPGFERDDLSRVFDRFYRAPASRGKPGSGLGLAIVRQVAESHGGSVLAENAPGGGALLTLRLPGVALVAGEFAEAFSRTS